MIVQPVSLPVCLSIADAPLEQTKSLQHRSHWRNALWDKLTSSFLSSSTPLTLISLTLIIAPSAWQRPYHKCGQVYSEPSLRNIKSPWQPLFISFASSACIIHWRQIWSPCYFPRLCLHPLFITSSFPPFSQMCVRASCLTYMCTRTCKHACSVCEKRKCLWH